MKTKYRSDSSSRASVGGAVFHLRLGLCSSLKSTLVPPRARVGLLLDSLCSGLRGPRTPLPSLRGPRAEGETEASRMQGSCTGLSHSVWKCHRGVWIAPRVTLSRAFCLETALQMGAAGSMETPEGALVGNQGEERARGGFPRNRRDPEQQTSFWSQCCTVWPPPHPCSGFRGRLGMRSKYPT
ncbi:uncharacterized protein LOC119510385 isoform X2 [Choloepus didactylus]|uniref:uncharacterized protein LOC119510385 isoform X2 n=1 Tax=Choloepus didactylus TaxID=27675 RepID=UPI0018A000BC|nr:uncharacterized protein LOC119510385 isoform X2 [Choloepus didactylus]